MNIKRLSYDAIMSSFNRVLARLEKFIAQQTKERDKAAEAQARAAADVTAAEQNIAKAEATRTKIAGLIGAPTP